MPPTDQSPVLAISGLPGSGKTTLAHLLGEKLHAPVIEMDHFYRLPDEPGAGVDFSDPQTIDVPAVLDAVHKLAVAGAPMVIVEGIFALTVTEIRDLATWRVWVDVPLDIGLARKLLRKLEEGSDIRPSITGYLDRGRAAYIRHVLPGADDASIHVDGVQPVESIIDSLAEELQR